MGQRILTAQRTCISSNVTSEMKLEARGTFDMGNMPFQIRNGKSLYHANNFRTRSG